jgi:hypothetical protein
MVLNMLHIEEWAAYANQYGGYGGSSTQFYSRVLVLGIDAPNNAPENYNIATVPDTLHQEMTLAGAYLLGTGIGLILCIPLLRLCNNIYYCRNDA